MRSRSASAFTRAHMKRLSRPAPSPLRYWNCAAGLPSRSAPAAASGKSYVIRRYAGSSGTCVEEIPTQKRQTSTSRNAVSTAE